MRRFYFYTILFSLFASCKSEHNNAASLTMEQNSALDALNILQTNTDKKNKLYSTFANIKQPCYPPDTNFTIKQSDLLIYMQAFVTNNCQNLNENTRKALSEKAVLAQEEYDVKYCKGESGTVDYSKGIPMEGTWVLPNVLGRRDVIIDWE